MSDAMLNAITWCFLGANAGRIFAYLPQMHAAIKCRNGATAISRMTWGYFAMAHLSGMLYGHFVIQDRGMVLVFLGNFIACCVLIGIVTFKKMRWRQSLGAQTGDMQHEAS